MLDSLFTRERWPESLILLTTSFLFAFKGLFSFLWTSNLGGRDLASNYAFTWLMQQNLLHGEIFSWTNQWLLGFPSFQLYPPVFFLFTSILDLFTGQILGLQFWFKALVFLSVFSIPLLAYYMMNKIYGRTESFFAGFYTLYFIFVYPPVSQAYQVFSVGLVAQGFAFLLVIGSIGFMLRDGRENKIISGALLGLTALSHPFVAIVGFLLSFSLLVSNRNFLDLLPAVVGGLIFTPWMINATRYLPYTVSYTFETANTGTFLYLLLPLIILGGYYGAKRRALLITFSGLLTLSVVELPLVNQELRFYTYSLGLGSILAGLGAFKIFQYLDHEFKLDKRLIATLLIIPVIGLSLHADLPQSWNLESEAEPLYEELEKMDKGRVLVETSNSSISDSFALQAQIPVRTKHQAVNDVHLDSSTSANYILTIESWISEKAVYNPICRTCNHNFSNSLVQQRLDDLGIRYVVARTSKSAKFLETLMDKKGRYGDYWLFENTEGYHLIESLKHKPVALVGSYSEWKKVNDRMFTRNISKEIVWEKTDPSTDYAEVIHMESLSTEDIVEEIKNSPIENISTQNVSYKVTDRGMSFNSSGPLKVKTSYYPGLSKDGKAGKFNTVVFTERDNYLRIGDIE